MTIINGKEYSFWNMVDCKNLSECWPCKGSLNNGGYGQHRKAYRAANGRIPKGLVVMHICNNRACCNPAHLKLGTQKENLQYAKALGRLDNRKKSLSCRAILKGTGVQYDKRSNTHAVMFKVLGRPLYIGMYRDANLARIIAKAALDEVQKLMLTRQHVTYEAIKEHFNA